MLKATDSLKAFDNKSVQVHWCLIQILLQVLS